MSTGCWNIILHSLGLAVYIFQVELFWGISMFCVCSEAPTDGNIAHTSSLSHCNFFNKRSHALMTVIFWQRAGREHRQTVLFSFANELPSDSFHPSLLRYLSHWWQERVNCSRSKQLLMKKDLSVGHHSELTNNARNLFEYFEILLNRKGIGK